MRVAVTMPSVANPLRMHGEHLELSDLPLLLLVENRKKQFHKEFTMGQKRRRSRFRTGTRASSIYGFCKKHTRGVGCLPGRKKYEKNALTNAKRLAKIER